MDMKHKSIRCSQSNMFGNFQIVSHELCSISNFRCYTIFLVKGTFLNHFAIVDYNSYDIQSPSIPVTVQFPGCC